MDYPKGTTRKILIGYWVRGCVNFDELIMENTVTGIFKGLQCWGCDIFESMIYLWESILIVKASHTK